LWNPDAAGVLGDDVVAVLRREAGSLAPSGATPAGEDPALIRQALATAVPTGDGALVFTLGAGFQTPDLLDLGMVQTEAPIVIEVPAELVATLATPFGQRVAAASDTSFVRDEIVPASREWVDCTLLPCVALTYDDGPSSRTPRLLDVLAEERATASFFVLGPYAASNRQIVARAYAEGHEIAGHTWTHPDMTTLTDEQIHDEVGRTNSLLQSITGARVTSFRPPYGAVDARVRAAAGLPAILWSVDTRDWAGPSDAALLESAIDDSFPGAIVLFHDTHERSVRLAPDVIAGLRDRGFTLVTVTQLFGGQLPVAGHLRRAS
jgi:peptidoglycan/xylan/chitin deacetylase (PgdA/CDA1 family)